jgi:hypothetical protein
MNVIGQRGLDRRQAASGRFQEQFHLAICEPP